MSAASGASAEDVAEERERDRQHRLHNSQLNAAHQQERDENTAEILRQLSEIDDLPIDPQDDPIMGQLISRLASTANLSPEQVQSNEWVHEYIFLLYICKHPHPDGLTGTRRAWAHGDADEYRRPLGAEKRMEFEALLMNSNLALSRSEDFEAVKESTRTISESLVRDESKDEGGGGLLGRWR